jgi:beta-1,4-mannosyl-glycoprotein beta-1,4-N-acetylglucosaminyltransferase
MKYSIVIPTYNHLSDLLKPCIESILKYTIMNDDIELIVVANGCKDNTREYLDSLTGFKLKTLWFDESIGYTCATNEGIKAADPTSEYIILLNNDITLLKQNKNHWIDMLEHPFVVGGAKVGITGPMKGHNRDTNRHFLIFFCVMIRHSVLREHGLLDEIFSPGSGEDVDFCIRLENAGYRVVETGDTDFIGDSVIGTGSFPIYHEGEKTVHDTNLVKDWKGIFDRNMDILAARYGKLENSAKIISTPTELPEGWFTDVDINTYRGMYESLPDHAAVIELGTWKGRSLCSVADIIQRKGIRVTAIDTFEGTDSTPEENATLVLEAKKVNIQDIFEENLRAFGIRGYVTVIKGSSADTHTMFVDKTFDLLFLDADHSYDAVFNDIRNWYWKVKPHGIFAGHDIAWTSVAKAVEGIFWNTFTWDGRNLWWVVKPKIYDCFPFFNEFDLLEIRLNELDGIVDEFVLVESTLTFSGKEKPLYFNENKNLYEKFLHKITHIIQDDANTGADYAANWVREEAQRDKMMEVLAPKCQRLDVIISSDLDEIPRASAVRDYTLFHLKDGIMLLNQKYSYYFLNNFTEDYKWQEGRIFPFYETEKYTLSKLRRGPTHHDRIAPLDNAGWHFSFLGDADRIRQKIEAFAHTEFDKAEIKTDKNINFAKETGADLFPRGDTKFNTVTVDKTFPKFILENIDKYKQLGYFRDPDNSIVYGIDAAEELNTELSNQMMASFKPVKLNLGCGNLVYSDFINIDLYAPEADVKMDIRKLEYPDNYADEIAAYHVFEHLSPYEANDILTEWLRVLKPNGRLVMELPDIESMCAAFGQSNKDERYRLLNCIYGATQLEHPHLFGWYPEIMQDHLVLAGYSNIKMRQPQLSHHWGINFRVEAYKPVPVTAPQPPITIPEVRPVQVTTAAERIMNGKPKVFDTLLFFNEFEILELRLNELFDVVDFFVILESNKTFTGKPKPFYFDENQQRFAKYSKKIINIKLEVPDELKLSAWDMEAYQRDTIFTTLQSLVAKNIVSNTDVIILSDVDEIPSQEAIINYDSANGMSTMNQKLYYYYLNCLSDLPWHGSRIGVWSEISDISASHLRYNNSLPIIENGGWHFSFVGTIDNMVAKIDAYSHQEFNVPHFTDQDKIRERIANCQDIFDRPINFKMIEVDETFPKHVINNKEHYQEKELLCRL